jgi:hypothetical protein
MFDEDHVPQRLLADTSPEEMRSELLGLRTELSLTKADLKAANEAKTFTIGKANEYSSELAKLTREYDQEVADLHVWHNSELKIMVEEKSALEKKVGVLEVADALRQSEVKRLEGEKEKAERMCALGRETFRALESRLKASQKAYTALQRTVESTGTRSQKHDFEDTGEYVPRTLSSTPLTTLSKPHWRHKKAKLDVITPCTQCFTHGWECDNDFSCENCTIRGMPGGCKRIMCKYYERYTCSNQSCSFVHEGNNFNRVIPFTRLTTKTGGPSPRELKIKEETRKTEEVEKAALVEKAWEQSPLKISEFDHLFDKLPK